MLACSSFTESIAAASRRGNQEEALAEDPVVGTCRGRGGRLVWVNVFDFLTSFLAVISGSDFWDYADGFYFLVDGGFWRFGYGLWVLVVVLGALVVGGGYYDDGGSSFWQGFDYRRSVPRNSNFRHDFWDYGNDFCFLVGGGFLVAAFPGAAVGSERPGLWGCLRRGFWEYGDGFWVYGCVLGFHFDGGFGRCARRPLQ